MLTISGSKQSFCDGFSRRNFLRIGGLALGGLGLPDFLRADAAAGKSHHQKAIIMVFLPGGPSHQDIWDLKPDAPVEMRGEFRPINTSVPGIQICEHLPKLAQQMDRFAIVRSLVGAKNEHASEQCFSGFGHVDSLKGQHPSLGSALAKLQGSADRAVPPFVSLCHKMGHSPWAHPGRAGFLGPVFRPFRPDGQGRQDMVLKGISLDRLSDRRQLITAYDRFRSEVDSSGFMNSFDSYTRQAFDVLTSSQLIQALDLDREDADVRQRYGNGSLDAIDDGSPMHNEDFLIARRLVEVGVRCVTLAFGRWDTHACRKVGDLAHKNNFTQLREYLPRLDHCLVTLVNDLHERGLQNDVSVVIWGEMGRTPKINSDGGRDHWPQVAGCILAGGGMRTGQVIGSTDRHAAAAKDRPVHYQEVFATLYRQLGVDVSKVTLPDLSGRPQYLLQHRKVVHELV